MAASLRHPLSWLVWLAMAVIYLPLLPAAAILFAPAFSLNNWQLLLNDPQLPQATVATLVSTLIATLGSMFIALVIVALLWPGRALATAQQPAAVAARRSSCGLCHQRFTAFCRRGPVVSGV